MKKLLFVITFLSAFFYAYSNANILYTEKPMNNLFCLSENKKDTNLFQKTKINERKFKRKIKQDNRNYSKNTKKINDDLAKIYVIFDKLLRANDLQYQNWRFCFNTQNKEINAFSGYANLISINCALYDSLYQNDDALAFIIAHELTHLILQHNQISFKNSEEIKKLQNKIHKNSFNQTYVNTLNSKINKIFEQERTLELVSDSEALILMTKAGYSPLEAKSALELLSEIPNINNKRSVHPDIDTRMKNIDENLFLNDTQELINQGKEKLLNSNVLKLKQSSDNNTIILSKDKNYTKQKYIPISKEEKLIKKAHNFYLNDDFSNAELLFNQAYTAKPDYVSALYLSYIAEIKFKEFQEKKFLNQARKWVKKAYLTEPNNIFVENQKNNIENLYEIIKIQKKYSKKRKETKNINQTKITQNKRSLS